jgi:hypothetical protein
MRPWIEKLAKISKERGSIYCYYVSLGPDFYWDLDTYYKKDPNGKYLRLYKGSSISLASTNAYFKLYDDEWDLLNEVLDYCENKSRDYIIEQINNL